MFGLELTVWGKDGIVNGFQTVSVIRMSGCVKLILFSGIISRNDVLNVQKELKKQVKL